MILLPPLEATFIHTTTLYQPLFFSSHQPQLIFVLTSTPLHFSPTNLFHPKCSLTSVILASPERSLNYELQNLSNNTSLPDNTPALFRKAVELPHTALTLALCLQNESLSWSSSSDPSPYFLGCEAKRPRGATWEWKGNLFPFFLFFR